VDLKGRVGRHGGGPVFGIVVGALLAGARRRRYGTEGGRSPPA
jgi:hypothetical protein